MNIKNVLASKWGIITVGALIGILATLLQKFAPDTGVYITCFERNNAGARGMHRMEKGGI